MDDSDLTEAERNELILYALGDAPAGLAERLRERAERDPALALQLDLLRAYGREPPPPVSRLRRLLQSRSALLLCCLLLLVTLIAAIGKTLSTPPLLRDTFDGTTLNAELWEKQRDVAVVEDGHLRLVNRGSVTTVREFEEPISVSLRWMWKDLTGGKETYADALTVGLRTSGTHAEARSFELLDGVRATIRGHSQGLTVSFYWPALGTATVQLTSRDSAIPPNIWHDLRITDDGETVAVYLSGPGIDAKYWKEPFLVARPEGRWQGHRVSIYNREQLADVPHESFIDKVVIEPLR